MLALSRLEQTGLPVDLPWVAGEQSTKQTYLWGKLQEYRQRVGDLPIDPSAGHQRTSKQQSRWRSDPLRSSVRIHLCSFRKSVDWISGPLLRQFGVAADVSQIDTPLNNAEPSFHLSGFLSLRFEKNPDRLGHQRFPHSEFLHKRRAWLRSIQSQTRSTRRNIAAHRNWNGNSTQTV